MLRAREQLIAVAEHRDEALYQAIANATNIDWRIDEVDAADFELLLATTIELLDRAIADGADGGGTSS